MNAINETRNVEEVIKQIISEVVGIEVASLEDDLKVRDELMIDSLKQIEIVAKVERHFDISLNQKKLMKIKTLSQFLELVVKTIKKK